MTAVYAWLARHKLLTDGALAFVLAVISLGSLIRTPAVVVVLLALTVPVMFRRRVPLTAFAIAAAAGAVQVLALDVHTRGGHTHPGPLPCDVALLILLYTVAAYQPRRYSVTALGICVAGSVVAIRAWEPAGVYDLARQLFVGLFLFGGISLACWVLGDSMRYRRGFYAALQEKAERLEAEREAQARIAAAAERARIARELHDVVAHHVSVMVVQADGAGYVLRSDPDRAQAAVAAVAATGRQALTELRRLLGVLRSAGQEAELAPVPGLGELRELLDQARAAGLQVSYALAGAPRELPEGAGLAAYRVVQEALTNVRKHAGPAATAAVQLRYEKDGLILEITDDGTAGPGGEPGGHGLAGMRERVEMYGGTATAGPRPGGGFGVRAWLPCPGPAAAGPLAALPASPLPAAPRAAAS